MEHKTTNPDNIRNKSTVVSYDSIRGLLNPQLGDLIQRLFDWQYTREKFEEQYQLHRRVIIYFNQLGDKELNVNGINKYLDYHVRETIEEKLKENRDPNLEKQLEEIGGKLTEAQSTELRNFVNNSDTKYNPHNYIVRYNEWCINKYIEIVAKLDEKTVECRAKKLFDETEGEIVEEQKRLGHCTVDTVQKSTEIVQAIMLFEGQITVKDLFRSKQIKTETIKNGKT